MHARSAWSYALAKGKAHGSEATFDGFEAYDYHMNAPAPTGPLLRRKFAVLTSTVVETQRSEDGTVKLLVRCSSHICRLASIVLFFTFMSYTWYMDSSEYDSGYR